MQKGGCRGRRCGGRWRREVIRHKVVEGSQKKGLSPSLHSHVGPEYS